MAFFSFQLNIQGLSTGMTESSMKGLNITSEESHLLLF